jgi:hypothetical protein
VFRRLELTSGMAIGRFPIEAGHVLAFACGIGAYSGARNRAFHVPVD